MAFANSSNITVQDSTFNDISGDQININNTTYNVSITSAAQYEAFINAASASESGSRQGRDLNSPSPSSGNETPEARLSAILDNAVSAGNQPLNWRESIVDLMKVLKLNSSFNARKALAFNYGYQGDPENSYARNVWLHKRIMVLLRENGGDLEVARAMIESIH